MLVGEGISGSSEATSERSSFVRLESGDEEACLSGYE